MSSVKVLNSWMNRVDQGLFRFGRQRGNPGSFVVTHNPPHVEDEFVREGEGTQVLGFSQFVVHLQQVFTSTSQLPDAQSKVIIVHSQVLFKHFVDLLDDCLVWSFLDLSVSIGEESDGLGTRANIVGRARLHFWTLRDKREARFDGRHQTEGDTKTEVHLTLAKGKK